MPQPSPDRYGYPDAQLASSLVPVQQYQVVHTERKVAEFITKFGQKPFYFEPSARI